MASLNGRPSPTLGALPLHLMVEIFSPLQNPWLYACRLSTVSKKFNSLRVQYASTLFRRVNFDGLTPYKANNLWRLLVEDGPKHYWEMVQFLQISRIKRRKVHSCRKCREQQTKLLRKSLKRFSNLRDLDISGIYVYDSIPDHWMLDDINKLVSLRTLSIRFSRELSVTPTYNEIEVWKSVCSRLSSLAVSFDVSFGYDFIPSYLLPATENQNVLELTSRQNMWFPIYPLIGPYGPRGPCTKGLPAAYFGKLSIDPHQVESFRQLTTLIIQLPLCLEGENLLVILFQCESITHLDVATALEVSSMNVRGEHYRLTPLPVIFFQQFARCRQEFRHLNIQNWITDVPDGILFHAMNPFTTLQEFFFKPRYRRVLVDRLSLQPGDHQPREDTDVLLQLVENCPQLKVLSIGEAGDQLCSCGSLHYPWTITNRSRVHAVQKELGSIGTLSCLSRLETLCLNNVALSSPTDVLDIVQKCKCLQQLVLSNLSSGPDSQRLPFLPEILRSGRNLTSLSILDEGMLFDDELLDALSNLHSIKEIMLRTKQVVVRPPQVLSRLFCKLSGSAIFILVAFRAESDAGVSELVDCERDLRPDCTLKVMLRLLEFDEASGNDMKYETRAISGTKHSSNDECAWSYCDDGFVVLCV